MDVRATDRAYYRTNIYFGNEMKSWFLMICQNTWQSFSILFVMNIPKARLYTELEAGGFIQWPQYYLHSKATSLIVVDRERLQLSESPLRIYFED